MAPRFKPYPFLPESVVCHGRRIHCFLYQEHGWTLPSVPTPYAYNRMADRAARHAILFRGVLFPACNSSRSVWRWPWGW